MRKEFVGLSDGTWTEKPHSHQMFVDIQFHRWHGMIPFEAEISPGLTKVSCAVGKLFVSAVAADAERELELWWVFSGERGVVRCARTCVP